MPLPLTLPPSTLKPLTLKPLTLDLAFPPSSHCIAAVSSVVSSTRQSVPEVVVPPIPRTLAERFWNKIKQIDPLLCSQFGICNSRRRQ